MTSTPKNTAHGYGGVTKSMLNSAVVNKRGNATYLYDYFSKQWSAKGETKETYDGHLGKNLEVFTLGYRSSGCVACEVGLVGAGEFIKLRQSAGNSR